MNWPWTKKPEPAVVKGLPDIGVLYLFDGELPETMQEAMTAWNHKAAILVLPWVAPGIFEIELTEDTIMPHVWGLAVYGEMCLRCGIAIYQKQLWKGNTLRVDINHRGAML